MTSETTLLCAVCGDTADDPKLVTECMSCSRTFHLNPYNDDDHRDCGDALIGPTQGVEFWCEPCLTRLNEEMSANPPDPRGMIDDLAVPAEFQELRRNREAAAQNQAASSEAVPAASSDAQPTTSGDKQRGAPPPRRARSRRAKRYRRIDD